LYGAVLREFTNSKERMEIVAYLKNRYGAAINWIGALWSREAEYYCGFCGKMMPISHFPH